jgi:hypothetical protein
MSELFESDKTIIAEEEVAEVEAISPEPRPRSNAEARRRLEKLLEDKRLRDELKDYLDD